jgi:hypothetical protein
MPNPTFGAANLQSVGVASEVTYGTPIAAPTTYFPCETPKWLTPTENLADTALRGSMGVEYQQVKGLRYDTINFKTNVYLDSAYVILRGVLGYPDTVSGTTPFLHKTSLQNGNNGQPASSTVFFYDAQGKSWQMAGAQISDVKITIVTGGLATLDVTYVGLPAIPIAAPTLTATTAKPMPSWNTTFTVAGTAYTKYSQLMLDIKRNTKMIPTITGSQSPFAIFAGAVSVSGALDGIYQGSTDTDLVANLTNVQPSLVAKIAPVGDAVNYLAFQCSAIAYDDTVVAGTTDWMTVAATIKALTNPTDVAAGGNQSPMLVTLANGSATVI